MKLHIKESYEDDMLAYKQAMTDYKQAMADYKQADADYKMLKRDYRKAYTKWKHTTADSIITDIVYKFVDDLYKWLKGQFISMEPYQYVNRYFDHEDEISAEKVIYEGYILIKTSYLEKEGEYVPPTLLDDIDSFTNTYFNKLNGKRNIESIAVTTEQVPGTERDRLNFTITLTVPECSEPPISPTEPIKPVKPTAPKNAFADYEVKKRAYYDPADDIEELFYNIGGNTIPNIEQKLRQAKWITGYDIYVPTGTQFKQGPNRRAGSWAYETLQVVGGPLDGLLLPFLRDDDELCVDEFIRKYCKRI